MSLSKFLNPKNDIAFRKIFGTEKNKDILIHFLNDMIVFSEKKPIKEVTFLKTVQDPEIAAKKTSIVDILCKDEAGNSYIVEMQVAEQTGFEKRAQYYAAKAYINQMDKGDKKYHDLKEVIFLAIADFVMFPDKKEYKSDHIILDQNTYENNLKGFSFTFLELGKFSKKKHELHSMIEKWAYYFKYAEETSEEDLKEIFKDDAVIMQAYEALNRFSWDEQELQAYEEIVKRDMDHIAIMDQKYGKGLEKGREQEKLDIAKKMLKKGLEISEIQELTGLNDETIAELALLRI